MIVSLQSYMCKTRQFLRQLSVNPHFHRGFQALSYLLTGFCLSAASLGNYCMPLVLSFVCACNGWPAVLSALGGILGYRIFWSDAGYIGVFLLLFGLPISLLVSGKKMSRQTPLLLPMVSGLLVAAAGVTFQLLFRDMTPIPIYLLRIGLAIGACMLFSKVLQGRNAILDWLATGLLVLSLAQIAPISYLGLGYLAAGFLCGSGTFPAVVIAGLGLDLAQITPIPMTAVLTLAYLVRFLPRYPKWLIAVSVSFSSVAVLFFTGMWDFRPLPGLLAGSLLGAYLPFVKKFSHKRGETGVAQVRLEMAAGVLNQTEDLLREISCQPVDEDALMVRAAERACGGCAYRKNCRDTERLQQLPSLTLHKPLLSTDELPIVCRKPGRYLAELHRCQEQLRSIRADRERQREYRMALIQQYRFLGDFLQELSDRLPRRAETVGQVFTPEVTVCGNRHEADNGDQCRRFAGVGNKYYVLLCDGMGTGLGAVQEGKTAASLLQKMLSAGYPAEYALRSLNSLCALRDRAGAVTIDLAEVFLDSGKVILYKWGAPSSYIVTKFGAERLGTTSAPPGISVEDYPEQVNHISLRKGEWLVMVSDGVGQREALRCCTEMGDGSPKELAVSILSYGNLLTKTDDATVAVLRLKA